MPDAFTRIAARHSAGRRFLLAVVPPVAAFLIRTLAKTLRYEVVCEPGATPGASADGGVWCFWHQCLLTSACYFMQRERACILISRSYDGELIARTVERLGFMTARGSSSRGALGGLREMGRAAEAGIPAVFPGDGPRGPKFVLKPGAIKLAQTTGAPAGVFHALPARAWRLKSWDGFLIPQPFTRVIISWARLVYVGSDLDAAGFEAARQAVEAALERARLLAEASARQADGKSALH